MEFSESHLLEVANRSRVSTLKALNASKSPHIGSCFSVIEILVATFGFKFKHAENFHVEVLLSKGHAAAALYSVLFEFGKIEESSFATYCKDDSNIYGHVDNLASPFIPLATGSLGHGLPYAIGLTLADRLLDLPGSKTIVILSDGELDEGTSWESLLIANNLNLQNLIVIVDRNRLQSFRNTEDTLALEPLGEKIQAFGFDVVEIDGHDIAGLTTLLEHSLRPSFIIANTVKGKGVSFMENSVDWHYRPPLNEDFINALKELGSFG